MLRFGKLNSLLTAVTPSFFVGLVQKIGFAKLNSPLTAVSPSFFVGRWLSFLFIGPGRGTAAQPAESNIIGASDSVAIEIRCEWNPVGPTPLGV